MVNLSYNQVPNQMPNGLTIGSNFCQRLLPAPKVSLASFRTLKAIENHRQKGESIAISDEQGKVKIIPASEIPKF